MDDPQAAVEDIPDAQEGRTRYRHRPTLRDDLARAIVQAARAIRKHYPIPSRIEADRRRQSVRPCFVPPESRSPEAPRQSPARCSSKPRA